MVLQISKENDYKKLIYSINQSHTWTNQPANKQMKVAHNWESRMRGYNIKWIKLNSADMS